MPDDAAARRAQWIRIGLLATLATACAASVFVRADLHGDIRPDVAKYTAQSLDDAVRVYRLRQKRPPSSLHDLVIPDANGSRLLEELPLDPWNRDYELRGKSVVSAGPNGVFGDGDDVSAHTIVHR